MELMIITGMSGAGKSQATNALEDIGYYCVDNMPPTLMLPFLQLCRQSSQTLDKVALVTDVRSGLLFDELQQVLPQLEANADVCRILFLDCSNEALRRRFKETRRQHPLAEEGRPIEQALLLERQMLSPLFEMADYRIDTTHLNTAQLKSRIADLFMTRPDTAMTVQVMSFGFKYGYPAEADLVLDMRCLPNPYYVPELRNKNGRDKEVYDYVFNTPAANIFAGKLHDMLEFPLETERQIRPLVADYPIHILEMSALPEEIRNRFQSDFRILAEYAASGENPERWETFMETYQKTVVHPEELLDTLSALSGDSRYEVVKEKIIQNKSKEKKGEFKMCEVAEKLEQRGIQKGIRQGIQGTIKICQKLGIAREQVMEQIMENYSLTQEDAEKEMRECWR